MRRATTALAMGLAVMAALPAVAPATTCTHVESGAPGPSGNRLVVTTPDNDVGVALEPVDGRLRVVRTDEDDVERLVPCAGGDQGLTSFDSVLVRMPQGLSSPVLSIRLEEGALGPGATPEPDGTSEIEVNAVRFGKEIVIRNKRGGRVRFLDGIETAIIGGPGPDSVLASTRRGGLRANLNDTAADTDFDLVVKDADFVSVAAGGGDDLLATLLAPGSFVSVNGEEGNDILAALGAGGALIGGEGDDRLTGGLGKDGLFGDEGADVIRGKGGNDAIFAGSGQDTVTGGGGRDFVRVGGDKERDRASCGAGPDIFTATKKDKLRGCETRFVGRRRGKFEQPTVVQPGG